MNYSCFSLNKNPFFESISKNTFSKADVFKLQIGLVSMIYIPKVCKRHDTLRKPHYLNDINKVL